MKLKKPSSKSATSSAAQLGGAVAGAFGSNIAFAMANKTLFKDAATENQTLLTRGAMVAVGAALAFCIDGSDTVADLVRGAGVGMATSQGIEIVKTYAAKSNAVGNPTNPVTRAIAQGLGLNGCGCHGSGLGKFKKRRGMGAYVEYVPDFTASPETEGLNRFERILLGQAA